MEFGDIKSISSILIANRGEISTRVSRTCQKMGIRSVAVFSDADRNMPFVQDADEAIFIGGSTPAESYLDQDKIINVAKKMGVDAIHPGYGFLSENVGFAKKCLDNGLLFIGPHVGAIDAMGSKSKAKAIMQNNKVPTVPGYQGEDQSKDKLMTEAKKVGFPLLLKATAGGGGKGMRIVYKSTELSEAIDAAQREAKSAFGDDEMIIEKYVESGRHIEFQIIGDQHGNYLHLLERECTIQRRYQKVIEESPSPIMTSELRERMGEAAVNAAKAIKYDNAGTVEFIYDDKSGEFYFLEVNTRLQVEHPVTEEITGLDIVQLQIECTQGRQLLLRQEDIQCKGYAIEARLYAEDPYNDFNPVTGHIQKLVYPSVEGLRIESAVETGSDISMYYDPMISKIIVHDIDRISAHRKLSYVLKNMTCSGMITNQSFLSEIIDNVDFRKGNYDTHFIQNHIDLSKELVIEAEDLRFGLVAVTLYDWQIRESKRTLLKAMPSGWRNSFYSHQSVKYGIGDNFYTVQYRSLENDFEIKGMEDKPNIASIINVDHNHITIELDGIRRRFELSCSDNKFFIHHSSIGNLIIDKIARFPEKEIEKVAGGYESPMPAQIIKVLVQEGQDVAEGDGLVIISSMKMESTIEAETSGVVEAVYVDEGQTIDAGYLMLKMTE